MTVVGVTGSRHTRDRTLVWYILDQIHSDHPPPDMILVVGYDPDDPKDQGVDQRAYEWAKARSVRVMTFPARWDIYGNPAGPRRNGRMVTDARPDVFLRFPGGRGTANCTLQAERAGIKVIEVRPESPSGMGAARLDAGLSASAIEVKS